LAFDGNGLIYFPHTNFGIPWEIQLLDKRPVMILVRQNGDPQGNVLQLSSTGCTSAGLINTPTVKTVASVVTWVLILKAGLGVRARGVAGFRLGIERKRGPSSLAFCSEFLITLAVSLGRF